MKKVRLILCVVIIAISCPQSRLLAQDPITVIIQQGIKKVIIAVDLKIQRLQNRVIWLQNAQKAVENTMSKLRLDEISDWVEKQRNLYRDYFEELWKVKDLVSYYHKVRDVTSRQILLVKEYKRAWNGIQQDKHFTPEEVTYMGKVYSGIMAESLKNLEQVILVIQSFSLQVTDAKRMELINAASDAMQQNYTDLKAFNFQNVLLSLQRAKDAEEIAAVRRLYGM
ncbi:conjugal transfer protein TraI [Flavisolibacter nicotianae]|uniref:conjugal transfer protein TraI n=1 Tax=Flavisolibacter nicotianae TaxID=2364882 RepID=UPI000EB04D60|nr:conjugal transfer protein TraI [Flavisolibacter nicotianae]